MKHSQLMVLFGVLTFLLSAPLATQAGLFENDERAWGVLHKQLDSFISAGQPLPSGTVILPLSVFQRVEWDGKYKALNLFYRYDLANTMPQWGPVYRRSTATVDVGYIHFLNQLNESMIKNSGAPNRIKLWGLRSRMERIQGRLMDHEKRTTRDWRLYVANDGKLTRTKWEEANGYSGQRTIFQRELHSVSGEYLVECNKVGPELLAIGQALAKLNNASQRMTLPDSEFTYELGKEAWDTYYRSFVQGSILKFLKEQDPETFSINDSEQYTRDYYKAWGGSAKVSWCSFFTAGGKTHDQHREKQWEQDTRDLKMSFANLKSVPISRGRWFDATLMGSFRDRINPKFWNKGGGLPLIPTEIIIAHGLIIDVKTTDEVGKYVRDYHQTSGNAGFSIGPFRIGGGGSYTSTFEETKVEKTSSGFSIEDKSGRAVVIAVICERQKDLLNPATVKSWAFPATTDEERQKADDLYRKSVTQADQAPLDPLPDNLDHDHSF